MMGMGFWRGLRGGGGGVMMRGRCSGRKSGGMRRRNWMNRMIVDASGSGGAYATQSGPGSR